MRTLSLFTAAVAAANLFSATSRAQDQNFEERVCENHLASVAPNGEVSQGSKQALVEAVESGKSIRVGFGLGRGPTGGYFLTHWFEAPFLTVLASDVFTQTPIIHRQHPQPNDVDILLPDTSAEWVGTLGTNGKMHSKFLNEDKVASFSVQSWWCLAN